MVSVRSLTRQLREMQNDPPPLCFAEPIDSDNDLHHWIGWVEGPADTPFAGGKFHLTIDFPKDYPFQPPKIRFTTPVYHPNISSKGNICLDILRSQWSPALSVRAVLISLCSLLADPNPEHGLEKDILKVYRTNKTQYQTMAREWTLKYATDDNKRQETQ